MSDLMMRLINAPWVGLVVGIMLGIGGAVFSFILYKKSKPVSRLRYLLREVPLIGLAPTDYVEELEVRYKEQPVPRVTTASFGVWNDGTVTIRGSDIVEADPLRIALPFEGGRILRATLEAGTRKVNDVTVAERGWDSIHIHFDYLDPSDGFRIRVLHSGEPGSLQLHGSIRGLPKGLMPLELGETFEKVNRLFIGILAVLSLVILGMFVIAAIPEFVAMRWQNQLGVVSLIALLAFITYYSNRKSKEAETSRPGIKGVPSVITDDPTLLQWWAPPGLEHRE